MRLATLFAIVLSVLLTAFAKADPPLHFATTEGAPFVYKTASGEWTGFDIELAQAIGEELKTPIAFQNYNSFPDLLKAVQDRKTDAAISSISITSDRAKKMEFSTPYFNSGLMIMTREQADSSFDKAISAFFKKDVPFYAKTLAPVVFIFFALLVVCTFIVHATTSMNLQDSFYAIVTADKTSLNRFWHLSFVLVGTVFLGIFVAQLTSAITTRNFVYDISLPRDLRGKDVATVAGTTSVPFLQEKGAKIHQVTDINDAYKMLEASQVDAIVYDAPTLQFYSKNDGAGKVAAVGSVFAQQGYGIALPEGSELRTRINQAILKIKENGIYDHLYDRYFGIE